MNEASNRDRELFGQLAAKYMPGLHAQARRHTDDDWDAHDLVQETLLEAWKKFATFRSLDRPDAFWPWVIAIQRTVRGKGLTRRDYDQPLPLDPSAHHSETEAAGTRLEDCLESHNPLYSCAVMIDEMSSTQRPVAIARLLAESRQGPKRDTYAAEMGRLLNKSPHRIRSMMAKLREWVLEGSATRFRDDTDAKFPAILRPSLEEGLAHFRTITSDDGKARDGAVWATSSKLWRQFGCHFHVATVDGYFVLV